MSRKPTRAGRLPHRLTPYEVRTREFAAHRGGVDRRGTRGPGRVADELSTLNETVRLLSQENGRLGRALRD
ncbi:cell division protein DivIVA [Micromonospora chokoriensis]|uniref:cell division protein DivIVA n=1 Tax=Micromonospora chokoriensis TaxID=356851 RepID=UPI000B5ACA71|nr:cell division protein DivIVA [Micromonospora chokoriensis]